MKKIGTITTSYALNYGAVLQTYALQKHLNSNGFLCEVIDYRPNIDKYGRNYYRQVLRWQDAAINIISFFNLADKRRFKEKVREFDDFLKLIPFSERKYVNYDDFDNLDDYDVLITGSDQVWNPELADLPPFFLQFEKGNKRFLSYAASVASDLSPKEWKLLGERIKCFDGISFRETESAELFMKYNDIPCVTTIDPVFLLDCKQWDEVAVNSNIVTPEKYVLCYFLGTVGFENDIISQLCREKNYKIINIGTDSLGRIKCDYCYSGISPCDFVALAKNADYILTNSFHMTAFSIIFRKQFLVISPINSRNIRMKNILKRAGMEKRIVYDKDNALDCLFSSHNDIDDIKLNEFINFSKNYLVSLIDGK